MAEPFSTAATIIALVGSAYKTGTTIYTLASGIKNAPQSIDRISVETKNLCNTLETLQTVLPDASALADTASPLHGLISNLDGVLQNCMDLLGQIEKKLEQFLAADGKAVKSALRGLRWQAFEKASIDRLQKDINTYKLTLVIACHSFSMAQSSETGNAMLDRMTALQRDVNQVRQCIDRLDKDEATLVPPEELYERAQSIDTSKSLCLKRFLDDTESIWSGEFSRNPSMAASSLEEEHLLRKEILKEMSDSASDVASFVTANSRSKKDLPSASGLDPSQDLGDFSAQEKQGISQNVLLGFNQEMRQYCKFDRMGLKTPSFLENITSTKPSNIHDRPLIVSIPWNTGLAARVLTELLRNWPKVQYVVQKKERTMPELVLQYQPIKATIKIDAESGVDRSDVGCQGCHKTKTNPETGLTPTVGLSYKLRSPLSPFSEPGCLWHAECFKCAACQGRTEYSLGIWIDVENNRLYCLQCFWKCQKCYKPLGHMALLLDAKLSVCSRCSLLVEPPSEDEKKPIWTSSVLSRIGFSNRKTVHYVPMDRDEAVDREDEYRLVF